MGFCPSKCPSVSTCGGHFLASERFGLAFMASANGKMISDKAFAEAKLKELGIGAEG
jgi:hypothetical protein